VPVILALKTFLEISSFLKDDLVILSKLRETMLYPAGAYHDPTDENAKSHEFARKMGSPYTRRASCRVDHSIYEVRHSEATPLDHQKHTLKSSQTLHLLRHAACLEALVDALREDKTCEELLGAKVDSRFVHKLFVVTATSLFSIFGQIMRKLVLSSEA